MLTSYHRAISQEALAERFSQPALAAIIRANLGQDNLRGQIGHQEYHFDNNAFISSQNYIEDQRALIRPALEHGEVLAAWEAFGRLTHTAQDLYAHSNYVALWLRRFDAQARPAPEQIDSLDSDLLSSPELRSGRLYYPLEALAFVPGLRRLVLPLLPRDSHAWMNLDSPARGAGFAYAYAAAVKRTRHEFDRTVANLPLHLLNLFRDC
jgi:hypothetical protein